MNRMQYFSLSGLILIIFCGNVLASRTVCNFNNSVLASNEVLIKSETNLTQCSVAGVGSPTLYTIENIAYVLSNSVGEKEVCGGWKLPVGYTVKRKANSTKCPNQLADFLVQNNAPLTKAYSFTTPKNTTLNQVANTTDPDNDLLIYSLGGTSTNLQLSGTTSKGGKITLNSSTGAFSYIPGTNVETQDSFSIFAFDQKSDPVSILVFVTVGTPVAGNQPPQFDYSYALVAEMNFKISFQPSVIDPDGDPVTLSLDNSTTANGKATSITVGTSLVITYTPNKNFTGVDNVKVTARDTAGNVTKGNYPITVKFVDSDGDGIADWYEKTYQLNYLDANDASYDGDYDGLFNLQEFLAGTSLILADTDSDGIPDGYEVNHQNFNPLVTDSQSDFDSDGYTNYQEFLASTNPNNPGDTPAVPIMSWLIPILSNILN